MIYKIEEITYAYGFVGEEDYESPDYREEYEFNTEEEAEEFIKTKIELGIKEYIENWDCYDVEEDDESGCVSLRFFSNNDSSDLSYDAAVTTWYKLWL